MATLGGPVPVLNGLGFCVDFANPESINSTTKELVDLSTNKIPVTLTNSGDNTLTITSGYADFNPTNVSSSATHYTISNTYFNTIKNEITLETAVYVTNDFGSGAYPRPVSPRTTETSQPLGFSIGSNGITTEVNTNTGWLTAFTATPQAGYNKWVYVTQTTSVSANVFLTYVNGVLVRTTSLAGSIPNGGNGLLIGRGFYGGVRNYSGRVGFVRVYSKALTQAEILQNYNATKGRYNL